MRRGWEVNSLAATAGPALAPAALSRLQAAASGLGSAAAETWQTQPAHPVHQVSPRNPYSVSLPHYGCPCSTSRVPAPRVASLPHDGCPCPKRGGSAPSVQARAATPAASGYSRGTSRATSGAACWVRSPRGLMPSPSSSGVSPFPVCWDQLRGWDVPPRSLRRRAVPVPHPHIQRPGAEARPRPWEAAARGHGEASPAWPWASSSLAVNYSVRGSACGTSAPATPPLMAKIDGFLISHGQKAPGRAARRSCPRCTAAPGERGTQPGGWFIPNSFPSPSSMHLEGCWAKWCHT